MILLGVHHYLTQCMWLEKLNCPPVTGVGLSWSKLWYCNLNPLDGNWFRNLGFNQSGYDISLSTRLFWVGPIRLKEKPFNTSLQRSFLLSPIDDEESRLPVVFTANSFSCRKPALALDQQCGSQSEETEGTYVLADIAEALNQPTVILNFPFCDIILFLI